MESKKLEQTNDFNILNIDLNIDLTINIIQSPENTKFVIESDNSIFDGKKQCITEKIQNTQLENENIMNINHKIKKIKKIKKKRFNCVCGKTHYTKREVSMHKINLCIDPNANFYKCICKRLFVSKEGFARHIKKNCH